MLIWHDVTRHATFAAIIQVYQNPRTQIFAAIKTRLKISPRQKRLALKETLELKFASRWAASSFSSGTSSTTFARIVRRAIFTKPKIGIKTRAAPHSRFKFRTTGALRFLSYIDLPSRSMSK